jgi:hypothetical protein
MIKLSYIHFIPTQLLRAAMERATQVDTFAEAGGDRGMANFGGEMGAWT